MRRRRKAEEPARAVVEAVRAAFRRKSVASLLAEGLGASDVPYWLPTGSAVLDRHVLGGRGIPGGRLVEVFGPEGCGKTSFVQSLMREAQRAGGIVILSDNECRFDSERAATVFGVDTGRVVLLQGETIEDVLGEAEVAIAESRKAIGAAGPVVFVWDSLAATPTKSELTDGLAGETAMGERARVLSRACRALAPFLSHQKAIAVFVNQIRDRIGVMFGSKTTTPGGHAVKFHATVRMEFAHGKHFKAPGGAHTGARVHVTASKAGPAPPWRKATLRLDYVRGWDDAWSVVEFARDAGHIGKEERATPKVVRAALDALGWSDLAEPVLARLSETDDAGVVAEAS